MKCILKKSLLKIQSLTITTTYFNKLQQYFNKWEKVKGFEKFTFTDMIMANL